MYNAPHRVRLVKKRQLMPFLTRRGWGRLLCPPSTFVATVRQSCRRYVFACVFRALWGLKVRACTVCCVYYAHEYTNLVDVFRVLTHYRYCTSCFMFVVGIIPYADPWESCFVGPVGQHSITLRHVIDKLTSDHGFTEQVRGYRMCTQQLFSSFTLPLRWKPLTTAYNVDGMHTTTAAQHEPFRRPLRCW